MEGSIEKMRERKLKGRKEGNKRGRNIKPGT